MADDDFSDFREHYAPGANQREEEPRSSLSRTLEALLWVAIVGTVASIAIPEAARCLFRPLLRRRSAARTLAA